MRPLVPTSRRWTTPWRSSAPLVETRCPAAARPPITVGPSQLPEGCAATPTGLSTTMMLSSSCTTRSPSTTSGGAKLVGGAPGSTTSRTEPASTRSDLLRTRPSRLAPPFSMTVAAAVRESPNNRLSAASSRRPSSPSGTGRLRLSVRRSVTRSFCLLAGSVDLQAAERQQDREPGPDRDGAVSDVEAGEVRHRDEVDDVPLGEARRAGQPVDEVAEGAAQQQAEGDRPGAGLQPGQGPHDVGDHRDRDQGEDDG